MAYLLGGSPVDYLDRPLWDLDGWQRAAADEAAAAKARAKPTGQQPAPRPRRRRRR